MSIAQLLFMEKIAIDLIIEILSTKYELIYD